MPNIRPLYDKVVVERKQAEEKTAGGIVLPDTAKDKPKEGTVVAVGIGKRLESGRIKEPDVAKGDRVLFGAYAGTEVKVGGKEFLILGESEILAVLEKP
jgi:chaperonin GroES